jgi:hypothetical protein|tara:strand:+ start:8363 stop:8716 length:354 start_codon:yes stop_codon:yes gene_type:complete
MGTKAELNARVAGFLGRKRPSQPINDELNTRINEAFDSVYADLKDDQLVTFPSTETSSLPNAQMPHLAALMAFDCTSDIGVSAERYQRIVSARNIAKTNIRRLTTPKYETVDGAEDF